MSDPLERLRDTFAAAALTGMMSRVSGKAEAFAEAAYKLADAMLRERERCDRPHPIKPADATPHTNTTPDEGTVQDRCTLTAEERAAILTAADLLIGSMPGATLRALLARFA
jgi:hypothetical protein